MNRLRARRMALLSLLAATGAVLASPTAASAQVVVTASDSTSGAREVALLFTGQARSSTAGINRLDVRLPDTIPAASVDWLSGPTGWRFARTGNGFTVSGPALRVGEDAEFGVQVRQLPSTRTVVLPTVQTYTDGTSENWNQPPNRGVDLDAPAPTLTLVEKVARPASTRPVAATSGPVVVTTAPPSSAAPSVAPVLAAGGSNVGLWWAAGAISLVAVIVVVVLVRRRVRPGRP